MNWKYWLGIAGGIGGLLGVVLTAPDKLDEAGFPVWATRPFVRAQLAIDRSANIIIRDALIDLTMIRRASLVRDRDALRLKLSGAHAFDAIIRDAIDRHDQDIAEIDETLAKLKRLQGQ